MVEEGETEIFILNLFLATVKYWDLLLFIIYVFASLLYVAQFYHFHSVSW